MPRRRSAASPFPPEHIESVYETVAPDKAPTTTKTEPAAPVLALAQERRDASATPSTAKAESTPPPPRRTLFAVVLQLARSFGALCVLVRAGVERDRKTIVAQALLIADTILFGARDRSRDKFPRSLFDQQQRSDSLHQPRPARPRPTKAPVSKGK